MPYYTGVHVDAFSVPWCTVSKFKQVDSGSETLSKSGKDQFFIHIVRACMKELE